MSRGRGWVVLLCAGAGIVSAAPAADAASRYASPSGTGPPGSCPKANPCSINDAVESGSVSDGDVVTLAAGDYTITNTVNIDDRITVRGDPAGARPRLLSGTGVGTISLQADGSVLSFVALRATDPGTAGALYITQRATAERVIVTVLGTEGLGVYMGNDTTSGATGPAVLRDSLVTSEVPAANGWFGVVAGGGSTQNGQSLILNTNIFTATTGLVAFFPEYGRGTANVRNSIIVSSDTNSVTANANGTAGAAQVQLDYSHFGTIMEYSAGQVFAGDGQLLAGPTFLNAPMWDYRQTPTSPSIDKGITDPFLGKTDLYGSPRYGDKAPDIGADETDVLVPTTTITKKPRRRTRKRRAKFKFRSSELGTFRCSLDGSAPKNCSSPRIYKELDPGRHLFRVFAVDLYGKRDASPAKAKFKVRP